MKRIIIQKNFSHGQSLEYISTDEVVISLNDDEFIFVTSSENIQVEFSDELSQLRLVIKSLNREYEKIFDKFIDSHECINLAIYVKIFDRENKHNSKNIYKVEKISGKNNLSYYFYYNVNREQYNQIRKVVN